MFRNGSLRKNTAGESRLHTIVTQALILPPKGNKSCSEITATENLLVNLHENAKKY